MNNIWIDLTDLFEWKGHFTGIQRVTYNYATRFNNEGARFFIYRQPYGNFVEIPFKLFEEVKEREQIIKKELNKRQKLKNKLKLKYKTLPKLIQYILFPLVKLSNKQFRKIAAFLLDRPSSEKILKTLPTAKFNKGDTILLIGATWNSDDLIDELAKIQDKLKLKIHTHLNDILPIYQPQLFVEELPKLFSSYISKALRISDVVSVISKATKADVIRYCEEQKIGIPSIEIIRLGEDITTAIPINPGVQLSDKFILCVGTLEIRKNYILLYQALKLAESEGKELPQIVIVGRKGWLTQDLQYIIKHDPLVKTKILVLEKMNDANLSWLYEHCLFTVFCSLAEGWGLPIAESLHHGKFCLSSNTSSMPEIAGDSIDYFNPYDVRECMEKIEYYAAKTSRELNSRIKGDYKAFTWDDSFESLNELVNLGKVSGVR